MEDEPEFSSREDRLKYWRDLAHQYSLRNAELQKEYDDHTATSAMLEKELETTLDQKEKHIRELRQQNQKLEREIDFHKKKSERLQQENSQFENEVKVLKNEKERHFTYIRELEQKNDDLERGQRVVSESVAGIETLLYQAYERNAVLESEVDEMENLRIKLQRVTDEARDLKQELYVKDKLPNGNTPSSPAQKADVNINKKLFIGLDSNRLTETETQTNLSGTPVKYGDITLNGNTMAPSSRISALNIVGDLLRKVGLERFLCPECGKVRCVCVKNNQQAEKNGPSHDSLANNSPNRMPPSSQPLFVSPLSIHAVPHNSNSDAESKTLPAKLTCANDPNEEVELRNKRLSGGVFDKKPAALTQRDRCLSLFSRGSSIRRTTGPPKPPPRSPTKARRLS